jgi:periplasmic protein TonB
MSTHKMQFTAVPAPQNQLEVVPAASSGAVRGDTFLDAMLEMPTTKAHSSRSPLKMMASLLIHAGVIALLIVAPIYLAKNTVSLEKLQSTYVFTPPPPAPPPPPAAAGRAPETATHVIPKIAQPTFVAPKSVPKDIAPAPAPANVAAPQVNAGVVGGVPGGVPGGLLGGLVGGTGSVPGPPPPASTLGIVRVGGNVKAPQLVQRVQPQYPAVARIAHVQGTVVIDAVIDKTGKVVSEHAVSGPNFLVPAALSAVQRWKYEPTYLNGQAVDLAMEVTVDFHLGSNG